MLGKLMKYEWKNIWRAGTLMLLGMFVVTVIGCVVLRMPGGLVAEIADGNDINAAQSWVCSLFLCGNTDPVCDHAVGVYLGHADLPGNPFLPQHVYG